MSENSAQLETRIRQDLEANFNALAVDAGFLAAQEVEFTTDRPGVTPRAVLYAADMRGPTKAPARPAVVVERVEFPNQRPVCDNAAITVNATLVYRVYSGVDPSLRIHRVKNERGCGILVREALAGIAGVEIDGPDDIVDDTPEDTPAEGEAIAVQGFRLHFTLDGKLF